MFFTSIDISDKLMKPVHYKPEEFAACDGKAREVLDIQPHAVNELYLWYSGFYMGECAPLGGQFEETCRAITRVYGPCLDATFGPRLYRVDRLDLPEDRTTSKPITSWSRDHAGARHFFNEFTMGVNFEGASRYGWRIISTAAPKPLVTYEATMEFLRDTSPDDLHKWLNCREMQGSKEVICFTPHPIPDLRIEATMPCLDGRKHAA